MYFLFHVPHGTPYLSGTLYLFSQRDYTFLLGRVALCLSPFHQCLISFLPHKISTKVWGKEKKGKGRKWGKRECDWHIAKILEKELFVLFFILLPIIESKEGTKDLCFGFSNSPHSLRTKVEMHNKFYRQGWYYIFYLIVRTYAGWCILIFFDSENMTVVLIDTRAMFTR